MARVHRLEHVERFGATYLADDDPVGPHAQRVAYERADRDLILAGEILGPRLEPQDMFLVEPEFGCILDRDDPLLIGDRGRERIEEGRLARPGTTCDEHVQLRLDAALEQLHRLLTEGPELDHVV